MTLYIKWNLIVVLKDKQYYKRWKGEIKASRALRGELGAWNSF